MINKAPEGYEIVNIGVEAYCAFCAAEHDSSHEESKDGHSSIDDDAAQLEGEIAQRVEQLLEGDGSRDEVIMVIAQFRQLVSPAPSLQSTVATLQVSLLGDGPDVEAEIESAMRTSSSSPAPPAVADLFDEETEEDSDDDLI